MCAGTLVVKKKHEINLTTQGKKIRKHQDMNTAKESIGHQLTVYQGLKIEVENIVL